MVDSERMEQVTRAVFDIKRSYEDGRVGISHKVAEAQEFVKKWSFDKISTYSADDTRLLDEIRTQLASGRQVMLIARVGDGAFDLYAAPW